MKVSRLIKRRETAKKLVETGGVILNGKVAKPASDVKAGDMIILKIATQEIRLKVAMEKAYASKENAKDMYILIETKGGTTDAGL